MRDFDIFMLKRIRVVIYDFKNSWCCVIVINRVRVIYLLLVFSIEVEFSFWELEEINEEIGGIL